MFINSPAPIIAVQAIAVELVEVLVAVLRLHQIGNIVTRTLTPG
ncbi:hypothetical protein [Leptolyngbya sp. FACHB-321]|nr:hypothetical protein [Leptolyngbya sp. FACHB-321]